MLSTKLTSLAIAVGVALFCFGGNAALAECPNQNDVCENFPPAFGLSCPTPSAWCEGDDCLGAITGAEIRVITLPEEKEDSKRALDWLVKHDKDSLLTGVGIACLITYVGAKTSLVELPDARHCAAMLNTSSGLYLEFFAGTETCHGWVECSCD